MSAAMFLLQARIFLPHAHQPAALFDGGCGFSFFSLSGFEVIERSVFFAHAIRIFLL